MRGTELLTQLGAMGRWLPGERPSPCSMCAAANRGGRCGPRL